MPTRDYMWPLYALFLFLLLLVLLSLFFPSRSVLTGEIIVVLLLAGSIAAFLYYKSDKGGSALGAPPAGAPATVFGLLGETHQRIGDPAAPAPGTVLNRLQALENALGNPGAGTGIAAGLDALRTTLTDGATSGTVRNVLATIQTQTAPAALVAPQTVTEIVQQ